jgi:hypothetical protein
MNGEAEKHVSSASLDGDGLVLELGHPVTASRWS